MLSYPVAEWPTATEYVGKGDHGKGNRHAQKHA